jgi:hypothetical protein
LPKNSACLYTRNRLKEKGIEDLIKSRALTTTFGGHDGLPTRIKEKEIKSPNRKKTRTRSRMLCLPATVKKSKMMKETTGDMLRPI